MRRILFSAAVATLAFASTASAQRRERAPMSDATPGVELGMDAALTFGTGAPAGTDNETDLSIPVAAVRAGYFLSPALSIEPSLGLQYASAGGVSGTHYVLGVGALYHFSTVRSASQIYVRPFINFESSSFSGSGSSTSTTGTAFGAGVGIKMPWVDRFATRFEANIAHNSNDNFDASTNRIGLLAGISYFTH